MLRAALFTVVGVGFGVLSLQMVLDPGRQIPQAPLDWSGVLTFSALLIALAFALPTFARLIGGRVVFRVSLAPAVGAALGSVSNILEDGLHQEWAFYAFVLSLLITDVGLFAFSVVVASTGRGRRRLLAAVPAATLAGVLLFPVGGGILTLAGWLAAAALALGWPALGNARAYGEPTITELS